MLSKGQLVLKVSVLPIPGGMTLGTRLLCVSVLCWNAFTVKALDWSPRTTTSTGFPYWAGALGLEAKIFEVRMLRTENS